MEPEILAAEVQRLQECINDLVSVLAVPAMWVGREPSQIVRTMLDSFLSLLHLDIVYLYLNHSIGDAPTEVAKVLETLQSSIKPEQVSQVLGSWVKIGFMDWPERLSISVADFNVVPFRLGLRGDIGFLVVGARRQDFPREAEHLLLSVAANQATIGLQAAQHLCEQRRVAKELDERVAQRTAELAVMNEELRRQIFERERAEEDVRDHGALLRQLIDSIAAEVTLCTPEGETVVVNRFCLELTGRPFKDHQDWAIGDPLYHPEDVWRVREGWARSIETGAPYEVEVRVRRPDGAYRWVHSHGFPIRDANERIFRWCTLHLDITDRKHAEEAQAASERKLELVINTVPGLVWSARPDGGAEFFNRHYIDYVGLSAERIQNAGWVEHVHPDDRQTLLDAWQHMMAARQAGEAEARLRRFDGEYRWFLFRTNPLLDDAGNVIQWFGVNIDIEDRKRAENALRDSEFKMRQLTEAIPQMLWTATPRGEIDYSNQQMLDYTGSSAADVSGVDWVKMLHPGDTEKTVEAWRACVSKGSPYQVEARVYKRSEGTYRWCLTSALPLRDEAGNILRWYGTSIDIHDRKLAQEALATSQRKLDELVNTMPAVAWSTDPDGYTDYLSRYYLDYVGLPFEDVKGWGWINSVHPDDVRSIRYDWDDMRASGRARPVEARLRRHDGEYRWYLLRPNPLLDEAGKVVKWYGVNTDIHDRRLAEEALAVSEQNLNVIINTLPAMVWAAHADGSAEFVNQHYLDYVGLSAEEIQGWGWTAAVHPDDLEPMVENWKRVIATRRAGASEARIRRFDGAYRWFLLLGNPEHDEAGNVTRWFGVNIDIEDRKRAEEAVRASEHNLRRMTETIPQMLWSATAEGAIDYCNNRLLDYSGLAMDDIRGDGWTRLLHPDDVEQTSRIWRACIATGDPYQVEVRMLRASDHTYRWGVTSALPLRDDKGRILRWHGTCVDMHDWKHAQDELREIQAELAHMTRATTIGQLTASIAHELNQPLAGIITNASTCLRMLAADPPNVSGARETARRTIRDGNRASEVITRLRDLFKKKPTAFEAVDMNIVAQEVIALTSNELQRNDVSLRVNLAHDLPLVIGDRVQLQQVTLNLILNAAEAMLEVEDREKELTIITGHEEPGRVRLAVKDAGAGFDPAMMEKLFNPFYTTKSDGMGIGLSVSRSIIESHQGRLGAELNDGPGATFWFSVPGRSNGGLETTALNRAVVSEMPRATGKA